MTMDLPTPHDNRSDAASDHEADRLARGAASMREVLASGTAGVTLRRFNVEEYYEMATAGILANAERLELLDGEIVQMAAIGSRHAECVDRLNRLLMLATLDRATVRVQNPVRLSFVSEPQPDIALVRRRPEGYAAGHPGPDDTLLVIEVSDATLPVDRSVKAPLYARAGIPEYWIVDLTAEQVEIHLDTMEKAYTSVTRYGRDAVIHPAALPDVHIPVDELLPPPVETDPARPNA